MDVTRLRSIDALPLTPAEWDRLAAGRFFLTWTWIECWWRHYSQDPDRRLDLYALLVRDEFGNLAGIAPWYIERSPTGARTVRGLGDGEVCSDYLSVLAVRGREAAVADALAAWLADQSGGRFGRAPDRWDHLAIDGVDRRDVLWQRLFTGLSNRGCLVHRRPGVSCWATELPPTLEAFMNGLSKKRRAHTRRVLARLEDAETFQVRWLEREADFERAWSTLVELHQRRWQSLGQPGSFASARFEAFHRDVAMRLLARGELNLCWLTCREKPIAAEYGFTMDGTIYNYQSGIDPGSIELEPGRMMQLAMTRRAIARQVTRFDYLRGEADYKKDWQAEPQPTWDVRAAAPRVGPRLAHTVWIAAHNVKARAASGAKGAMRPWREETPS